MHSFPSIFCRFRRLLPFTAVFLFCGLLPPHPVAAEPAVYLGRDADGRQLFKIGALTAALSAGDRLGPCVVGATGLDCPPSADAVPGAKKSTADAGCDALLRSQEEKFQARYLKSLEEYTENLRRKNYELVEESRKLQELRTQLARKEEKGSTADNPKTPPAE